MPELHEQVRPDAARTDPAALGPAAWDDRLRAMPGLVDLVAEAEGVWRARAAAAGAEPDARPGWRTFEDAFPTFYEFTNRPR